VAIDPLSAAVGVAGLVLGGLTALSGVYVYLDRKRTTGDAVLHEKVEQLRGDVGRLERHIEGRIDSVRAECARRDELDRLVQRLDGELASIRTDMHAGFASVTSRIDLLMTNPHGD
jgi:hypothetical protein